MLYYIICACVIVSVCHVRLSETSHGALKICETLSIKIMERSLMVSIVVCELIIMYMKNVKNQSKYITGCYKGQRKA